MQMKLMKEVLLVCVCLSVLPARCVCFSRGASTATCMDMKPGHISPQPQHAHTASAVTIHTSRTVYLPQHTLMVSVRSSRAFMGLLLHARSVVGDRVVGGKFTLYPPGTHTVSCLSAADTVTHSDKLLKRNLSFTWRAPAQPSGDLRFYITIVHSYFVYWTRIHSAVVHDGTRKIQTGHNGGIHNGIVSAVPTEPVHAQTHTRPHTYSEYPNSTHTQTGNFPTHTVLPRYPKHPHTPQQTSTRDPINTTHTQLNTTPHTRSGPDFLTHSPRNDITHTHAHTHAHTQTHTATSPVMHTHTSPKSRQMARSLTTHSPSVHTRSPSAVCTSPDVAMVTLKVHTHLGQLSTPPSSQHIHSSNTLTHTPTTLHTSSHTPTASYTLSHTPTALHKPTHKLTASHTTSHTPTASQTHTPVGPHMQTPSSASYTLSHTPIASHTLSHTPTALHKPTHKLTASQTQTQTHTPVGPLMQTPSPASSHPHTHTPTASYTLSHTPPALNMLIHTLNVSHPPMALRTHSHTPVASHTLEHTPTASHTPAHPPTSLHTHEYTPIPLHTPTNTSTHTPTASHTPTNTPTHTTTLSHTPTNTPTHTPTASHTPTNTLSASHTTTNTSTHTPTASHPRSPPSTLHPGPSAALQRFLSDLPKPRNNPEVFIKPHDPEPHPEAGVKTGGGVKRESGAGLVSQPVLLLVLSLALLVALAVYIQRKHCVRRSGVSLSTRGQESAGVRRVEDCGELVQLRRIRENSLLLLQAQYDIITAPGN